MVTLSLSKVLGFILTLCLFFGTSSSLIACPKIKSVVFSEKVVPFGSVVTMKIEVHPIASGECASNERFQYTSTTTGNMGTYTRDRAYKESNIDANKAGTFTFTVRAYGDCGGKREAYKIEGYK